MAVRLQMDANGSYIPDSKTWMYDEMHFPLMTLNAGLDEQLKLCEDLIGKIKSRSPCDLSRSIENLSLSIFAFRRDLDICKEWVYLRAGSADKPRFYEQYFMLMKGRRPSQQEAPLSALPVELLMFDQAEEKLVRLKAKKKFIPVILLEHKIDVLAKSVAELQTRTPALEDSTSSKP